MILDFSDREIAAIRLAAEAYAASKPGMLRDMADSMDLSVKELHYLFEENERKWEIIKDAVVAEQSPSGE